MTEENKSYFDPNRQTVGKIYRDLQISGPKDPVINGDLTNELMSSLVEDINDTVNSKPYGNKPFYIQVHEKKDLVMPRAIHREIRTFLWRPYPEDDTIVFWVHPESNTINFCWCLPHSTEMDNMLANPGLFNHDMLQQIKDWKMVNLHPFGFIKVENVKHLQAPDGTIPLHIWEANPNWKDEPMQNPYSKAYSVVLPGTFK